MKLILALLIGLAAVASEAHAQTFTAKTKVLRDDGSSRVFRGVINTVVLPVDDEAELGSTQSGYFLFTSDDFTVSIKGDDDKMEEVKGLQMFHLTPSPEQAKKFDAALGKPVEVKATLMLRNTRHHRTAILLEVLSFQRLKP